MLVRSFLVCGNLKERVTHIWSNHPYERHRPSVVWEPDYGRNREIVSSATFNCHRNLFKKISFFLGLYYSLRRHSQLPTPIFRARFLPVHARVSRIVWKGFAPLSLAVSTVVRTSASAFAAHMAR
jgi:hypothetical protein